MISAKKLINLARKWQKLAAIRRKRITLPLSSTCQDGNSYIESEVTEKGHFVVYSVDQKRFVLSLTYLNTEIFRELFNLAEEEYGLSNNRPLTLPRDSAFMEHVITLIKRGGIKDVEKALLASIPDSRCLSSSNVNQQISICSF